MQHRSRFARRLCIAVDAEGYGGRDDVEQYNVQADLPDVLDEAAVAAGLDRSAWARQAQGDGELALVPPDQPEPRLIDDFIRELAAVLQLRNHNRAPAGRLRLRVAIAFGVAYEAPSGFAGGGVVATARLLASGSLHQALAEADDSDLAVALSPDVYQTVLHRHTSLASDQFTRVQVVEKEFVGDAWIRILPGAKPSGDSSEARRKPSASRRAPSSDRAANKVPAEPYIRNDFHAPVDAGVIGINLGSVNKGRL